MEDLIAGLVVTVVVISLIVAVVKFTIVVIATTFLWFFTNVLVITETVFALWHPSPIFSWMLSGLALGSATHFALIEHRRLANATPVILWVGLTVIAVLVGLAFGAGTLLATPLMPEPPPRGTEVNRTPLGGRHTLEYGNTLQIHMQPGERRHFDKRDGVGWCVMFNAPTWTGSNPWYRDDRIDGGDTYVVQNVSDEAVNVLFRKVPSGQYWQGMRCE
ncbi:MAG: hypothetical protein HLUCCA12_17665 [Rhodobacteraceae bacterium HLUCCA12]|nr:MAG: hypothetical protein HLUCCA12_17665 [Rhodobacteraceae bacterium HLUCCA12]